MKKILISISIALLGLGAFAQSVETKGFYPPVARKGQAVQYSIALKGVEAENISPSQIPAPKELQYIGNSVQSRMSITNMRSAVRETILTFNYIPLENGEFEIGQWEFSSGGKKYKIAPAKLKVDPSAPAPQNAAPDPFEEMEEMMSNFGFPQFPAARNRLIQRPAREAVDFQSEIKADVKLDSEKIYVGQAVLCEVSFKFSKKFFASQNRLANIVPSIKNSDAFVCNGFFKKPETKENEDGSVSVVFLTVVSPLKAGEFNLQFEANAAIMANTFSFFGSEQNVSVISPQKNVKILELPKENMPADFSGAIGKFKIESAKLDESSLSVGEPCVMEITISGEGNFDRFSAPALEGKSGWKDYKPKVSFNDQSGGYACIGSKTFSYTIVPTKPDLEKTPAAAFSFFNPATQKYETLKSAALSASVAPSKSYAKKESQKNLKEEEKNDSPDIINGETQIKNSQNSIVSSPLFWAAQIAVLAALCVLAIRKSRKNRLLDDPAYAQKIAAKADAKKCLARAKAAAKNNEAKGFFESGSRALQNALCAASAMPPSAITRADAVSILKNLGCPEESQNLASQIFDGADAISFGGYTPQSEELDNLYTELEKLCKELSQN
ncbi:MAG: BatD family protein [Opitutales bacterium]|nr:BatD family protein [Opitutales bacterium]